MKFGSSGIRGVVNTEITSESALCIGRAVGSEYRDVVVGRDPRTSSEMIEFAAISGLLSMGCQVTRIGMVATPTLAYAARSHDCGVMITASHNPPEYAGVKLFNPDGMAFDSGQQESIEGSIEGLVEGSVESAYSKLTPLTTWDCIHPVRTDKNAVSDHISMILSSIRIEKQMLVVVDCGCGAASLTTPYLLRELGCDVITLNSQPDGFFPGRSSEPKEENLASLRSLVREVHADVGIAHDGDADRMVAVDDTGRFVSNDKLLAFFGMREAERSMVVPVDTSMLIDAVLPGVTITRTRVGDVYVAEEIKRTLADFGGEASGTWIFPKVSYCPDGIYAAARLVEIISREEGRFSDHISALPQYEIKRGALPMPHRGGMDDMRRIEEELRTVPGFTDINTLDGVRIALDDAWALVRPSGTEPLIRITVEGKTRDEVERLYLQIEKIIKES
ncbi:MAG: phosphoglucosamine mutase [Methanosarcinales archaeon]|nr:phosphoglucosamine mutase [Methanosarcinales archaeon]